MKSSERDLWTEKYKDGLKWMDIAPVPKTKPVPVKKARGMNKTETAYALELEALKYTGEIEDYRYEPCGLRLADKTFYHPDFLVVHLDHFEFVEIKGFERDDAIVKFKTAAALFPWFKFSMIKKIHGRFIKTREL